MCEVRVYRSREEAEHEHCIRASHLCVCPHCGKLYIDHPFAREPYLLSFTGEPFLHRLCSGLLAKL